MRSTAHLSHRRVMSGSESILHDMRSAVRALRRSAGISAVAVLTLALGVGATTALFNVVYAVVIDPFPQKGSDRLISIRLTPRTGPPGGVFLTARQLSDLRRSPVVDDAIAMDSFVTTLTGGNVPEVLRTDFYSGNGLAYFGVRPELGRIFTEADAPPGEEPRHVVVLTHAFWQTHFGSRPDVIGQTLHLDQVPYTVIGVAPPRFLNGSDIIVPIHLRLDPAYAWGVQTRLKPGVGPAAAEAALQPLFEAFAKESPARFPRDFRVQVTRLLDGRRAAAFVPTLSLVFAAAAVLLLVACVTTSILLLARGAARQRDLVVRQALGATRGRLVRQLLLESLAIAITATSLGVVLAYWLAPLAVKQLPPNALPLTAAQVPMNTPVLLFSAGLAIATGLLFGVSPAIWLSRPHSPAVLQGVGSKIVGGPDGQRVHHLFVALEVALTMVLLAASGAAVRELLTLYDSSLGYDPSHVLLATATLPEGSHEDWRERAQFIDRLQQQIASTPQVQAVGLGVYIQPPPRIGGARTLIEIPGQTVSRDLLPILQQVSSGYFGSLSIRVAQGRIWSRIEGLQAAHVAVINETMARRLWPGGDAIGGRVRIPQLARTSSQFVLAAPGADGWVDIVGIVGDTPNVGLREPPAPVIYVPHTLMLGDMITFAIRTSAEPLSLERSVREQVRSVDPNQALTQVRTAERALVDAGWARERFVVALTAAFGAFALLLAIVGLFSVVSFAVSSRVREFGVRMALGARATSVMRLALLRPFVASMIGVFVGVMLSVAINRSIARWSVGNLGDPMMLTVVAAMLGAAAIAAAVGPALRATRIQPSSALRTE